MERYQNEIAPHPDVSLIHVSMDEDEGEALKWARKFKFPWPTILLPDQEAAGLNEYGAFAGEIFLVDSEGEVITKDEGEAFAKIAALK